MLNMRKNQSKENNRKLGKRAVHANSIVEKCIIRYSLVVFCLSWNRIHRLAFQFGSVHPFSLTFIFYFYFYGSEKTTAGSRKRSLFYISTKKAVQNEKGNKTKSFFQSRTAGLNANESLLGRGHLDSQTVYFEFRQ
jgi:hypothetical protein